MPGTASFSKNVYGFDPTTITGCILWLDGADPEVLFSDSAGTVPAVVSGTIGFFRDKSRSARNYIQNSAVNRPSYSALGTINFNTSGACLSNNDTVNVSTSSFFAGGYDIFAVGTPRTVANSTNWRTLLRGLSTDHPILVQSGGTQLGYFANNTFSFNQFGTLTLDGTARALLYVSISPVLTYRAALNGTLALQSASNNGNNDPKRFFSLGNSSTGGGQPWGALNEIIICSNVMTPQRQAIEGYLARKWGLQNILPNNHPFKVIPTPSRLFTPLSIANCVTWLDAADPRTVTLSSGNNVSSWRDKSFSATTATALVAGAGRSITYGNNSIFINNASDVLFQNSNTYAFLRLNSNSQTTADYSIFVVVASCNYGNNQLGLLYANFRSNFELGSNDTRVPIFSYGNMFESGLVPNTFRNIERRSPADCITLLNLQSSSSNFTLFYNGTFISNVSTCNIARFTADGGPTPTIGGALNQALTTRIDNRFFTGRIYELIVYNQALVAADRILVEGYLGRKWGIQQLMGTSFPIASSLLPNDASISSGLRIWCQANIFTSAGTLTTWPNSGDGTITLSCTGNVVLGQLNGLPIVRFATTSIWRNDNVNFAAFTVFFVGRQISPTFRRVLASTNNNQLYGYWNGFKKSIFIDGNPSILGNNTATLPPSNQDYDMIAVSRTVIGPFNMFWNGTLLYASQLTSGVNLTGIGINTTGESSTCEVAEIIIYNTVLNTTQIRGINVYLANKWGLTLDPLGQPFSYAADASLPPIVNPNVILPGTLVFWMDASQETGVNGSFVNSALDRSGTGYTITATTNNTITLQRPGLNNMPVYNFGDNRMTVANFQWRSRFTVAFVTEANRGNFLFSQMVTNYLNYIYSGNDSLINVSGTNFRDSVIPLGTSVTGASYAIWILQYNNVNSPLPQWRLNGTLRNTLYEVGAIVPDTTTIANLFINGNCNVNGQFDTSRVAEICFYNDFLSQFQCQQLEGYLATKWGLKNLLPVTHPYYVIPPSISPNPIRATNFLYTTFFNLPSGTNPPGTPSIDGPPGTGWGAVIGTAGYYNPINFLQSDPRIGQVINYGITCTGFVYSSTQGTIRFRVTTDDGACISYNGVIVFQSWQSQAPATYLTDSFQMNAGYTPFVLRHFQGGGGGTLLLEYDLNNSGVFLSDGGGIFFC